MDNKVLAVVNGKEITEQDMKMTAARFPSDKQGFLATEEGKKQLLDQMISFELLYNFGKDNGLEKDQIYLTQLESAKKEILTKVAMDSILAKVSVSDKEIEEYYEANKEQFKDQGSITARHILVQSKEKAEEVKVKIQEGMSFEDAAKEYSSCPSKAQGGSLGNFTRGRTVPEFEEVAFNLEVGVISDPVKTKFGYHLIKVEEKVEGKIKSLEAVRPMLNNSLLQNKQNIKYMEMTKELKTKYKVEIV